MSDEQTLTMDESPETEVLSEEEQDSLKVGEQMEAEQNQLLAGKYKDPKDLEKAYTELEKKLGEKSDEVSEEVDSKNETEDEAPKNISNNLLDQLWDEGTNNKLSKETFEQLQKMDPVEVAKMAMQQRSQLQNASQSREFTETDVQQIQGLVGGQENYNNLISWASENVSEQEVNLFDAVMDKGDPLSAYFAVQAMALKYQDAAGKDGQLVTGKAPKSNNDVFRSQQELIQAQSDPRYENDEAYQEAVLQKLARSNVNF